MSPPASATASRKSNSKRPKKQDISLPPEGDWRTTDEDEINRRKLRAQEEPMAVRNLAPHLPVHSNFKVTGASGVDYEVEIRDVPGRDFHCTCTDFRINGLGTCKHVESTLAQLALKWKKQWPALSQEKSARAEIVLDRENSTLAVRGDRKRLPASFRQLFGSHGLLSADWEPETAIERLGKAPADKVRVSLAIAPWLERRGHEMERTLLRREYEAGVVSGTHPPHETLVPLYPYQREGMMHLAFTGRASAA